MIYAISIICLLFLAFVIRKVLKKDETPQPGTWQFIQFVWKKNR